MDRKRNQRNHEEPVLVRPRTDQEAAVKTQEAQEIDERECGVGAAISGQFDVPPGKGLHGGGQQPYPTAEQDLSQEEGRQNPDLGMSRQHGDQGRRQSHGDDGDLQRAPAPDTVGTWSFEVAQAGPYRVAARGPDLDDLSRLAPYVISAAGG